jgi:hypothetical protein
MTYCLCQPRASLACVERNFLPRAHILMMRLPTRELKRDRLLVDSLVALGLAQRAGAKVFATPLGHRTFTNLRLRMRCSTAQRACRLRSTTRLLAVCDARPDCWRPDPGSVSFRNPCW